MVDDIQKYNDGNKPQKTTKRTIAHYFEIPFVWILIRLILFGLAYFIANGLLDKPATAIITCTIVVFTIIIGFNKKRADFTEQEYWIGIIFSIVFFVGITVHLFIKTSGEESQIHKLSNENKILRDSLDKLRDSVSNSKTFVALATNSKVEAKEKLDLAKKYFKVANKPIISVSDYGVDSLFSSKHPAFHCKIENVGSGSAIQMSYYVGVFECDSSSYDSSLQRYKLTSIPPMQPKKAAIAYSNFSALLSQEKIQKIKNKTLYLYFYGVVYYCDEFNKKDSTGFCVIYDDDSLSKFRFNPSHNY